MNISRSACYGMMAVGYIAQHQDDAPVLAEAIAQEYDIPTEYLLKILQLLVRANLLRSKRGPGGGFSMARDAAEINLLEIIEAVSGPLAGHLDLAVQTNNAPFSHRMEEVCRQASTRCIEILKSANIARMLK